MNASPEYCHERVCGVGPTRFFGYACCGRINHDGEHFVTEGGKVVFKWEVPATTSASPPKKEPGTP